MVWGYAKAPQRVGECKTETSVGEYGNDQDTLVGLSLDCTTDAFFFFNETLTFMPEVESKSKTELGNLHDTQTCKGLHDTQTCATQKKLLQL